MYIHVYQLVLEPCHKNDDRVCCNIKIDGLGGGVDLLYKGSDKLSRSDFLSVLCFLYCIDVLLCCR